MTPSHIRHPAREPPSGGLRPCLVYLNTGKKRGKAYTPASQTTLLALWLANEPTLITMQSMHDTRDVCRPISEPGAARSADVEGIPVGIFRDYACKWSYGVHIFKITRKKAEVTPETSRQNDKKMAGEKENEKLCVIEENPSKCPQTKFRPRNFSKKCDMAHRTCKKVKG